MVLSLGIVADGIGGENAGERAAELTVSTVIAHLQDSRETNIPLLLDAALREANARVYTESRKSRRKTNMGSTAAIAAISNGRLYVANVGDSRVYLLRGTKAYPLTIDHTWEHEVVGSGRLTAAEAARHPRRDAIVRSIGYEKQVEVDLGLWLGGLDTSEAEARAAQGLPLQPGDTVLVCSDGLIKSRHDRQHAHYVEAGEFASLVRGRSPKRAVATLIKRALSRRVDDNVSVAILEVPGGVYLRRYLVPGAAVAGVVVVLAAAGAWAAPRLRDQLSDGAVVPTIPALPSGVAYVSEIDGRAEVTGPGGQFQSLREEQLITAGPDVRVRTVATSQLRLGLANQTVVYLGSDSELGLLEIAGLDGTLLVLLEGAVVVSDQGVGGSSTAIVAPNGTTARLAGSLMGARWQSTLGVFDIDCFEGTCSVTLSDGTSLTLAAGEHLAFSPTGGLAGPDQAQAGPYAFAGALIDASTAEPGVFTSGLEPTRTPLGPLFVSPTPPPPPPPTRTPEPPPGPPPPAPTQPPPPTNTSPPPTETPEPSDTPPGPPPSKTPKPDSPTNTPPPTDPPATDPPPTEE